jgi:hypothetical protein
MIHGTENGTGDCRCVRAGEKRAAAAEGQLITTCMHCSGVGGVQVDFDRHVDTLQSAPGRLR